MMKNLEMRKKEVLALVEMFDNDPAFSLEDKKHAAMMRFMKSIDNLCNNRQEVLGMAKEMQSWLISITLPGAKERIETEIKRREEERIL
jgi:hypothetical protein